MSAYLIFSGIALREEQEPLGSCFRGQLSGEGAFLENFVVVSKTVQRHVGDFHFGDTRKITIS